ncbi:MAG: ABC transporter ATP-binding protein, partial [Anaerolineales bacterium]|nr:ABC transporter ATP-binding protein [Anaerolineales bacterium]
VTKSYVAGKTAVSQLSLSIAAGEIVCLLGPSGCGKTTLLRLMAGLEQPDAGEVWFNGRSITHIPPHQRGFGMMFQDYALFPHKNVFDNVAFGLHMRGDGREAIAARVAEMLALVDLTGFERRTIDQLSGGEQQRVALARALAPGPTLLMLDEPLGALDRALRERLMVDVRQILRRVGVTAVYVTHDQTEAFAIADRVAVMNAGQIEQIDRPEQVYGQPATPFVARFLGFGNILPGEAGNGVVETAVGQFNTPSDVTGSVTVLLRPDGLASMRPADGVVGLNEVVGQITAVSFRGRYYQLWVQTAGLPTPLIFETDAAPDDALDTLLCFVLDETAVWLWK